MNRRCLESSLFLMAGFFLLAFAVSMAEEPYTAYLMAYFGPEEKLYYAWSRDARHWKALNDRNPVFDAGVRLRDPFVQRANGRFHMVHTKGWDHPTIFHWESADLIEWKGGAIDVVPAERKRAWAPEFFFDRKRELFHLFWASIHEGHNTMHVVTTLDWNDITPDRAQVFYDIGIHDIDLTIVEFDGLYLGFHKPGDVHDRMGNRLSTSRTLDPRTNTFAEARSGKIVFPDETKPTEGPEIIKLIGQDRWYVYGDPFNGPMEAWETSNFVDFEKIAVETVPGSKHCSMLPITEAELDALRRRYPDLHSETYKTQRGITTILPNSKQQPGTWKYTLRRPDADWFESGFDDRGWRSGRGGFGTTVTPNTEVGTLWDSEEIWLRRTVSVDRPIDGEVYVELHHDENTTIYVNGVLAAKVTGYNTDFELLPVEPGAATTLKPGRNTIAAHCVQTAGGQYIDLGLVAVKEERWSRQKAWQWFDDQPWPCGFDYIPANAISYTELWMPYSFDTELIDRELALAEEVGFNCLRVVLPFVVWEHSAEAFKKRLDSFLSVCDRHDIKVMLTLFDDCVLGPITDPVYGEQPALIEGWYANGWTPSPGHGMVRDPSTWPRLEKYVKDIVSTFGKDRRVWVWDLYNEPTAGGLGDLSIPLVEKVFAWARAADPLQPLTVGQWNGNGALNAVIFRLSDIVTFHDYSAVDDLARHIETLRKHGRPLINTEWLNRGRGSLVETCLRLFAEEKVGCMHWGLVNGRTQTDLNWGHRPGQPDPPVWQHDIFRGDSEPYDPGEIELFKRYLRDGRAADKKK